MEMIPHRGCTEHCAPVQQEWQGEVQWCRSPCSSLPGRHKSKPECSPNMSCGETDEMSHQRVGYCCPTPLLVLHSLNMRSESERPGGARAAKREVRVGARGRSSSHATRRSRLMAAAMATCCKWVLAMPYQHLSSDSSIARAEPAESS